MKRFGKRGPDKVFISVEKMGAKESGEKNEQRINWALLMFDAVFADKS